MYMYYVFVSLVMAIQHEYIYFLNQNFDNVAQSVGAAEYTDCISAEG